ncbi:D-alanyl-D-alanine carboxypeptidase [Thiospirochaeta perfilievii]|uniref:D-alanyl-D-alanine carboxypeptidase n=1 Tax=Thiospirochaeta perfilievii TaxID=252967 RepID=A0A5C1QBB6_9SPIO|nr:serine hydrolase [Thiospirochaeta perfilievii]QEN04797.1 D-alanyl-D-alanine carboxypeptidase [Thiospirochaeta perfilievii]
MRLYLFLFLSLYLSTLLFGENLELWAETAILIDYNTKQILYQKNKDLEIPPASMTKLVTLFIVYEEIAKGNALKDDLVTISSNADYRNLPRDSSLMFIEQGQRVTLLELMKGLAIPSGNDAAIAIAEHLFGSVDKYLYHLNSEFSKLGLDKLKFVDSSGFDDFNSITVSQFVEFCLILLERYPEITDELFMLDNFTYPKKVNGYSTIGSIKQLNHNPLVSIYPGVKGLKTGFINKSGMNISLYAENNDRKIVGVIAGVKDPKKDIAAKKRFYDSITLLNYGFQNYQNIYLDKIKLPKIKTSKGNFIQPIIPYKRLFTLNNNSSFKYRLLNENLDSSFLGYVEIKNGQLSYNFPIYQK